MRKPPTGRELSPLARGGMLAAGAALSTTVGFLVGIPWMLPLLGAAVPYPLFLSRVRARRYGNAAMWVLVWAVFQSSAVTTARHLQPERARKVILQGPEYVDEMFTWIRTGVGPEGSPEQFLPVHARHFGAFCVLSVATAGGGSLVLGTVLLNYMNYYVAELVATSTRPWLARAIGWPPWALLRVAGFVIAGAALAGGGLSLIERLRGARPRPFPRRVFAAGISLVVMDALLKAALAPAWRALLMDALSGGGGG